jgi:plasmid maintenance system antidote protein VapI
MVIRLAKAFGGSPETWLKLQLQYELAEALKNKAALKTWRAARAAS